jgi:hypothetical protein
MLHELDRELERQGLRYVRYADDFSIYLKSKHQAQSKVGNTVFLFLKEQAETAHQPRQERHPQTRSVQTAGLRIRAHVCQRRTGQVSTGGGRWKLEIAQTAIESDNAQNQPLHPSGRNACANSKKCNEAGSITSVWQVSRAS